MAFNLSAAWRDFAALFAGQREDDAGFPPEPFAPAVVRPGTYPAGREMAMDAALHDSGATDAAKRFFASTPEMLHRNMFVGYSALSLLQQNGIVEAMVTTLTDEMMRKWLELEGDKAKEVQDALDSFEVRKNFRWAAEMTAYQGGALLFLDMGVDDPEELAMPLSLDAAKIPPGSFKGFRQVEPYCAAPAPYNASNPLADDYFKPTHWYIQGVRVHRSRFLHFAWNTPPVLLRPAYNFFGIPLPQMALPYVLNFERARDAASQLVYNFSLLGLKTNLMEMMQPGGVDGGLTGGVAALKNRVKTFLGARNNNGLALIDKGEEEFFQINTPLSGVEGLVAQQLELISLISRIPVTKLFGTPPRGFNATGESDERFFNDQINSVVARLFVDNFKRAKGVVELSSLGALQPQVTETWRELVDPDPLQNAQINLSEAQTDALYMQNGVILNGESRRRLNNDPTSPFYNKLDMAAALPKIDRADVTGQQMGTGPTDGPDVKALAAKLASRLQAMGGSNG